MQPYTIFIPVYNEEEILEDNVRTIQEGLGRYGAPFEIVLGSNGSTDRTVEIGEALAQHDGNVAVFSLPEKGVGTAFKEGVVRARYDRIVSLDMDLSVDLDFVGRAVELLDEYDIVVGSKKMGTQRRSLFRRLGSGTFTFLVRLLLGIRFDDYSIAAKAYRKEIIDRHLDRINYGSSYVIDLVYLASREGAKVVQIPVECEDHRASRFNLFHEFFYRFKNIFALWIYSQRR